MYHIILYHSVLYSIVYYIVSYCNICNCIYVISYDKQSTDSTKWNNIYNGHLLKFRIQIYQIELVCLLI